MAHPRPRVMLADVIDVCVLLRALPLVAALALASCDDDPGEDESGEESSGPTDDCSMETRDDTYMLGLTKSGERVQVRFVEATPAPPARFDNTWTVAVLDTDDMPMPDLAVEVTPFMPDHQHGTTVVTNVEPGANPGEYVLDPVNLHMPGLWEVAIDVTLADETTDSVTFAFCIEP